MQAIRLYEFGPAENLRWEAVDDPAPGPDQVRIAVKAAGVHFIDTVIRSGRFSDKGPLPPPRLPTIPGREVAGVVESVGANVDRDWLGTPVVAHLGTAPGGYAELAVRDVDAVHAIPAEVDFDAAVAMIGTGRTAMAILELAGLTDQDVALVTAAAGGIGTLITQYAHRRGITVVGVAGSADKTTRARHNGAQITADYTRPGWAGEVRDALGDRRISVVFDGTGGTVAREVFGLLDDGGRFVTFGGSSGEMFTPPEAEVASRAITVANPLGPYISNRPGGVRSLEDKAMAAVAAGELAPAVQPFPLAQAADAHFALENRLTMGKVVLIP